jgi:DHA2 family multidrug resistance protein
MTFGLLVTAYSLMWMDSYSIDLPQWDVAMSGLIQGFGVGFVYVPLTTLAFATLGGDRRNEAAGVFNLMRNVGSSVGISVVIALLTRNTQIVHSELAKHATPFNPVLHYPTVHRFWDLTTSHGIAALNQEITRQASMIGYIDDYKLIMVLTIALIPAVLLFKGRPPEAKKGGQHAMVMD